MHKRKFDDVTLQYSIGKSTTFSGAQDLLGSDEHDWISEIFPRLCAYAKLGMHWLHSNFHVV